ncbi:reverse transcriptase [Gossypium australe]|uniref:Reverse transcriptase n=1 Tax=Gossypium australe TaxID=47621 RepID=A0A5B6V7A0_9ROSI|nr:reverse transcriptase [Gossypium australe]
METKLNISRMEKVRRRCGFFNGIDVPAEGSRGGLSLGWNGGHLVTLKSFSKNHIDVEIQEEEGKPCWRFTGFYGAPEKGGLPREEARMEAFRKTLEECSLEDIGFIGLWFTWERGRTMERNIRERINRGVATDMWLQSFPNFSLWHLSHSFSDHCPLLVDTEWGGKRNSPKRFRFESWWILEESCETEIKKVWERSAGSYLNRLSSLANGLKIWAKTIQSKRKGENERLNRKLKELNGEERSEEVLTEIMEVKLHLNMEIDKEERYWEQRARSNWLQVGDKNTSFFHKYAKQRRRINQIRGLQRFDGSFATNDREIEEGMNQSLGASYIENEIIEALKGMGPTKALGFDGFLAIFFQKVWHIVGKDTCDFCMEVLNNGRSFDKINRTLLVLILKTTNPINLKNFRPISLCTVLYKIIAKVIANRLQKVLDVCIDDSQSAFVPGRLITDNVLLACEVLYSFKNKRSGKKGFMALKLDMSKAYDRVEWSFVKAVMMKMGFAVDFIELIFRCLTSVQFSILINGKEGLNFKGTRGLRQGDPLSPYLFLFCGEGLSALMRMACQEGKITGAKVCRGSPSITHLMFADDCILFGEVSNRGVDALRNILQEYEVCSG